MNNTPNKSTQDFIWFLEDDTRQMTENELDQIIAESGIDYSRAKIRLAKTIAVSKEKVKLNKARAERLANVDKAQDVIYNIPADIETMRAEIGRRLQSLKGGNIAVYNRSFEGASSNEELAELLRDLQNLEKRSQTDGQPT